MKLNVNEKIRIFIRFNKLNNKLISMNFKQIHMFSL